MLGFFRKLSSWLDDVQPLAADETAAFALKLGSLEVGTLRADKGVWIFSYSDAFRNQSEIRPIVDFPVLDREYRSTELWPFFALRIPSPSQAVVQELIGRSPDGRVDEGVLLKAFGSRSIANPFRLVPLETAVA